jgi:hypothetical protein
MDKACLLAISLFQALNREQLRELQTISKIVNYSSRFSTQIIHWDAADASRPPQKR